MINIKKSAKDIVDTETVLNFLSKRLAACAVRRNNNAGSFSRTLLNRLLFHISGFIFFRQVIYFCAAILCLRYSR